jgi:hypothetical protein
MQDVAKQGELIVGKIVGLAKTRFFNLLNNSPLDL